LLLAGTIAPAARAAEPTKAEIAVARQYFDAATTAENQGRWRDAMDNLNKAIAIKETAGLRYHLGFAKENLGMLVEAMLEYQRASGLIRSGMTTEEVERFIVPKLDEMRKRVPTLTVTLPPDVKDAQLRIDGSSVKAELLGAPIPLNPGTHALVVFAPGRRPFHAQVSVSEGSAVTQAAELVPEFGGGVTPSATALPPALPARETSAPSAAPSPPVAESVGSARTWVLIGEGVVTAAGLGIGIGYLLAASSAQARFDEASPRVAMAGPNACAMHISSIQTDCDTLTTSLADRHRDKETATAGFIGAGVGAGALVATLLLWRAPTHARGAISVAPLIGPTVGGASFSWKY
jgi:hypothetical protein